jgi:hypothetical protein
VEGEDKTTKEEAVPSLSERRIDAWSTLAAEPAVRAAERAIVTESTAVLADTLAISSGAEARRRLARVLDLKEQADRDPTRRDAYRRAADDLRSWAAGVYLATTRAPHRQDRRAGDAARREPGAGPENPHTEESISLRRSVPRPPFPGQPRRSPFDLAAPATPPPPPDPIERWEWEGGAVADEPVGPPPAPACGARNASVVRRPHGRRRTACGHWT